jgi:hypothetical protein
MASYGNPSTHIDPAEAVGGLAGFDVRQHARTDSISKRAPSTTRQRPPARTRLSTTPRHQLTQEFRAIYHECARTSSDERAKSAMFSGDFETCDGSKNRRLDECKISIDEVLISVTLSVCGEVAERLKAAVC